MANRFDTHEVANQPPPLTGYDVFGADAALVEALDRHGAGWAGDELHDLGRRAGSFTAQELGRRANENPPALVTHDRYGNRVDRVRYHPAYHELMTTAIGNGLHAAPWADGRPGAHVARAAKIIVWYQVDGGHICPISMTYSVIPSLRHVPAIAAEWEPRLTSRIYDPTDGPAGAKGGATCGMGMTEKQGGSDVRANTTVAHPIADGYALTGHKWFCSAPMSDAFLMLAQAPQGLSCFLVPRWLPDGTRNPIRIQRLKDKLGDRSNASSEVELVDTWGALIGEEGRGIRTIIEMVNHTRLDCVLGSTAIMRQGVAQATWHTHHRTRVRRAPRRAAADDERARRSRARVRGRDRGGVAAGAVRSKPMPSDEHEQRVKRLVTPIIKYWTCKRAPQHAAEALECLGGAGYVEESDLPAPVPAEPAERRVGGIGQRHLPRRAACDRRVNPACSTRTGTRSGSRAAAIVASTTSVEALAVGVRRSRAAGDPRRAVWSSASPPCSRPRCSCAMRRRPSPTPSARRA